MRWLRRAEPTTPSSSRGTAHLSSNSTFRVRTNVCATLHVMLKDNFLLKLSQLLETTGPAIRSVVIIKILVVVLRA
jgi:hypothetical protein